MSQFGVVSSTCEWNRLWYGCFKRFNFPKESKEPHYSKHWISTHLFCNPGKSTPFTLKCLIGLQVKKTKNHVCSKLPTLKLKSLSHPNAAQRSTAWRSKFHPWPTATPRALKKLGSVMPPGGTCSLRWNACCENLSSMSSKNHWCQYIWVVLNDWCQEIWKQIAHLTG